MAPDIILPLVDRLESCPPHEQWLWCAECERFLELRRVVVDDGEVRCPFDGCRGNGFDFDLLFWDSKREPDDPRWPASAAELRHGMRSPDMASFYRRRARRRRVELLAQFEASPERTRLDADHPLCFVAPFLHMSHCYAWEVDDDFFHAGLAAELVDDLPRWAYVEQTDRARMFAELRAFWAFAARTGCLPTAAQWVIFLSGSSRPRASAGFAELACAPSC